MIPASGLIPRLMRFAAVGFAGFVVDVLVLGFLHSGFGVDPLLARFASMPAAVVVTWRLNRAHTFASTDGDQVAEALRYGSVVSVSLSINYAVYALCLLVEPRLPPVFAVAAGSGLAMSFSYLGYSRFVFAPGGATAASTVLPTAVLPATLWPPSSEHSR